MIFLTEKTSIKTRAKNLKKKKKKKIKKKKKKRIYWCILTYI